MNIVRMPMGCITFQCLLLVLIGACKEESTPSYQKDFLLCDGERATCLEEAQGCQQDKQTCMDASNVCTQKTGELENQLVSCTQQTKLCPNDATRCDGNLFQVCHSGNWLTEKDCGSDGCGKQDQMLGCNVSDIFLRLKAIDLFSGVEELKTSIEGRRAFSIKIRQPLDHNNPQGPTFNQRFVLIHSSSQAPMTLMTTGYGLFVPPQYWADYQNEVSLLLGSNLIILEHRYFEESMPLHNDPQELDWSYLTIYQSASDSHRILETLRSIYPGAWVATGASKGGMTAIFHRHFYPDDLAGIVPYVAPISFGVEDMRYDDFLKTIGPQDGICRERLKTLAVDIIETREELATMWIKSDSNLSIFQPVVIGTSLAVNATGLFWSSWQHSESQDFCNALPPEGCSAADIFPFTTFSGMMLVYQGDPYDSYGYQVYAELGQPYFSMDYLLGALQDVDFSVLPTYQYPSWYANPPTFNPDAMPEVIDALEHQAQHVVGIYGEYDPWTAGKITVNESLNSKVFIAPGQNHGASVASLAANDRQDAIDRIQTMVVQRQRTTLPVIDQPMMEKMRTHHAWYTKILMQQEAKASAGILRRFSR